VKGTIDRSLWKPVATERAALLSLTVAWVLSVSVSGAVQFEGVQAVATTECRARFLEEPLTLDEEEHEDAFESSSLSRFMVTAGRGRGSWWPRMGSPKASFFKRRK
jgi:hypothetical protein